MDCRIFLLNVLWKVWPLKGNGRILIKKWEKIVVGAYSPSYGFGNRQNEKREIYKMINESGANVVFSGVVPNRRKWIFTHKDKMPEEIFMALGTH